MLRSRAHWNPSAALFVVVLTVLGLGGCARYVQIDDPVLKPFQSMYAVRRDQYGMTPLPSHAEVFVEKHNADPFATHGITLREGRQGRGENA